MLTQLRAGWTPDGWRVGVSLGVLATLAVFIVNLALTAWALTMPDGSGEDSGRRVLFQGSCARASELGVVAHLVINVLGSVLLSASNYAMQCLSAPTRDEVDRAHSAGKWLDIGVPSLRNLRHIRRQRVVLWVVLGLMSVPLHLL